MKMINNSELIKVRLDVLKMVLENGSENARRNPLEECERFYQWVINVGEVDKGNASNKPTKAPTK